MSFYISPNLEDLGANYSLQIIPTEEFDTNLVCFLCLQKPLTYPPEYSGFQTKSVQNICQYLTARNLLSAKSRADLSAHANTSSTQTSFSVLLCSTCSNITTKLSALINQLETIQKLVNHHVQEFQKTFQALQEKNREHLIPDKYLRTILKETCDLEVKQITRNFPTGNIEQITILQSEHIQSFHKPVFQQQPNAPEMAVSLQEKYIQDENLACHIFDPDKVNWWPEHNFEPTTNSSSDEKAKPAKCINANKPTLPKATKGDPSLQERLSKPATTYFKENPTPTDHYECLLCNSLVKRADRQYLNTFMSRHLAVRHVELYFDKIKHKSLDSYQFAKYCDQAVITELGQKIELEAGNRAQCPHCTFTYNGNNTNCTLRFHMLRTHYEILKKKVARLQKGENIDTLMYELVSKRRSLCKNWKRFCERYKDYTELVNKKYVCKLCKARLSGNAVKIHLVTRHPETLFLAGKNSETTSSDRQTFHQLCSDVLDGETKLGKKVKYKGIVGYKCHICKSKFRHRHSFTYHLANKHYSILEKNLNSRKAGFPTIPKVKKKKIRNSQFSTAVQILSEFCTNFSSKIAGSRKTKCILCNGTFYSNLTRRHFATKHVEKLFAPVKLENVTDELFGVCCRKLIRSQFVGTRLEIGLKISYKCKYCPFLAKNSDYWKYHLVVTHYDTMKEILVRLQTDKVLEQKSVQGETLQIPEQPLASIQGNGTEELRNAKYIIIQSNDEMNPVDIAQFIMKLNVETDVEAEPENQVSGQVDVK